MVWNLIDRPTVVDPDVEQAAAQFAARMAERDRHRARRERKALDRKARAERKAVAV